jgi:putative N6-adenine-specific DNA methylase
MCGSGTIAIEAALRAAGVPPAADRDLALRSWPCFEPGTWASVSADAGRMRTEAPVPDPQGPPRIVAADRDAGAIEAARANAERAGVADRIEFRVVPVAALEPPVGVGPGAVAGLVAANPPWGGRLGGGDLRNLYATLGRVAAEQCPGWGIGVLVADRALARQVRPGLTEQLHLELGGRPAHWLTGRLG